MFWQSQLKALMDNIGTTTPHYIRCVNPNGEKAANSFVKPDVLEQLRSGGVMEAVRVTRAGFPARYPHKNFLER